MDVKEQIRAIKDDEGELTVDKLEIADILNRHFGSVFIKEPSGSLPGFENSTNVCFGIKRVHTKINEFEIEKG